MKPLIGIALLSASLAVVEFMGSATNNYQLGEYIAYLTGLSETIAVAVPTTTAAILAQAGLWIGFSD